MHSQRCATITIHSGEWAQLAHFQSLAGVLNQTTWATRQADLSLIIKPPSQWSHGLNLILPSSDLDIPLHWTETSRTLRLSPAGPLAQGPFSQGANLRNYLAALSSIPSHVIILPSSFSCAFSSTCSASFSISSLSSPSSPPHSPQPFAYSILLLLAL